MTSTVFDRSFGLEIEIGNRPVATMATVLREAGFNVYNKLNGSLNRGPVMLETRGYDASNYPEYQTAWRVVYDGSVAGGCEVVSPILSGAAGLAEVKRLVKALNKNGAKADERCGLHVHVDARNLSVVEIQHVARRYAAFEGVIDGFVKPSRRKDESSFCKSMAHTIDRIDNTPLFDNTTDFVRKLNDRYVKLNLLAFLRHGTVEFRQLEGTTSWTKIVNWIQFCIGFVEASRLPEEVTLRTIQEAEAMRKKIPTELLALAQYPQLQEIDIAYLLKVERRLVRRAIDEINSLLPGSFTPHVHFSNTWVVKVPMDTRTLLPAVTGTWNDGIPLHVSLHLNQLAKLQMSNGLSPSEDCEF